MSSAPLRRTSSRALRAAIRACAEPTAFVTIVRASEGLRSNQSASISFVVVCTNVFASVLPSFCLVWPSNCGSASLMEMIAARPSRMSSPVRLVSFSLRSFLSRAYTLTTRVSAARKPSSWVPPSAVLIVLANVYTDSL
jgi:hypothetical protein